MKHAKNRRSCMAWGLWIAVSLLTMGGCGDDTIIMMQSNYGAISGIVKWPGVDRRGDTGLPLFPAAGAKITLMHQGRTVTEKEADREGMFVFSNLSPGSYSVGFTYPDCADVTMDVTVAPNTTHPLRTPPFNSVLLKPDPKKKPWTVLMYVNSTDHAHARSDSSTLRIMEKTGSNNNVNLVALSSDGLNNRTRLYYLLEPEFTIDPDPIDDFMDVSRILSPYYDFTAETTEIDPGEYQVLEEFLTMALRHYPADNTLLIISGHGDGINMTDPLDMSGRMAMAVSPNPTTKREITMPQLAEVLHRVNSTGAINMLAFQACFMGMFEVLYELKDRNMDYLVVSEATVGARIIGKNLIEELAANPDLGSRELAKRMVSEYAEGNTLAAIDMSRLSPFVSSYNSLARSLNDYVSYQNANVPVLLDLLRHTQRASSIPDRTLFLYDHYYDLRHFTQRIKENQVISSHDLKQSATEVYDALEAGENRLIIHFKKTSTEGFTNAHGLSTLIYNPEADPPQYASEAQAIYRRHRYYQDGNVDWDSFLQQLAP